jgi:Tol biopolymer transport system component
MKRKSPNYLILAFVIPLFLSGCKPEPIQTSDLNITGKYLNMTPSEVPQLLAPDLLASSLTEYNGTFNPEGDEFFFTTNTPSKGIICYTQMGGDGAWSTPKVAGFSGIFSEYDPLFSPDGNRLYFSSERPIPQNAENTYSNIWYVDRNGKSWSEPVYIDLNGYGNYYSSITNSGVIYFNVWNKGDMFKAIPGDSTFTVERLPDVLNSDNGEGDPFISPQEDYIIFRGYNNSLGNGDLFISFLVNGQWTSPENLGEPINSKYHEMCPYVTVDGKYFIFSSSRLKEKYKASGESSVQELRAKHQTYDNGDQNIYYMSADFIESLREKYIE